MKKIWLAVLLAASLLLTSCALFPVEQKDFTKGDMTITLTNRFIERQQEGYTVCYDSASMGVFALREEFGLFEEVGYGAETSLADYRDLVLQANEVEAEPIGEDGLVGFRFTAQSDGQSYTFSAYVYKSTEAFWLLQFVTRTEDFSALQNLILSYAKSVTVS
ncbi:MAG: hypothetical protein IKD06_05400 [Clostridia bacterium]|nr:hypothetical protein [Clostridia bacterium]